MFGENMGERATFATEEKSKAIPLTVLAKELTEKETRKRLERAYLLASDAAVKELKKQGIDIDKTYFRASKEPFVENVSQLLKKGLKEGQSTSLSFEVRNEAIARVFAIELQKQLGIERPADIAENAEKMQFEDVEIPRDKLPLYISQNEDHKTCISVQWPPWVLPSTTEIEEKEDEQVKKQRKAQLAQTVPLKK